MPPLIYGRILFKFAVHILQITPSSMGYLLFIFTHRTHGVHVCASARVVKHSLIFGQILCEFAGHIIQMTTHYISYTLIMFTRASARV
jgi:hypothetical protein